MPLSEECAKILDCRVKSLRDNLNHPMKRRRLTKELIGRKVRTTYKDRNGMAYTFFIGGLSKEGAEGLRAYGRLPHPFNICVAAHFYARHRIRLEYPYLPCVIQRFPPAGEDRFYPLELLEFVDDEDEEE